MISRFRPFLEYLPKNAQHGYCVSYGYEAEEQFHNNDQPGRIVRRHNIPVARRCEGSGAEVQERNQLGQRIAADIVAQEAPALEQLVNRSMYNRKNTIQDRVVVLMRITTTLSPTRLLAVSAIFRKMYRTYKMTEPRTNNTISALSAPSECSSDAISIQPNKSSRDMIT